MPPSDNPSARPAPVSATTIDALSPSQLEQHVDAAAARAGLDAVLDRVFGQRDDHAGGIGQSATSSATCTDHARRLPSRVCMMPR
jgi:hypothetical protein